MEIQKNNKVTYSVELFCSLPGMLLPFSDIVSRRTGRGDITKLNIKIIHLPKHMDLSPVVLWRLNISLFYVGFRII